MSTILALIMRATDEQLTEPSGGEPKLEQDASVRELESSRRSTRKGKLTRSRLVLAAKEVFEEDGLFEARIADIAKRAGVSHGTFYTYFTSKQEIFREVALKVDETLGAPLGDVILDRSSSATPRERIRQALHFYLERYRQEARIMGVIEQVTRYDPVLRAVRADRIERERKLVAGSIERLQRQGLVDSALNPTIAAAALGSMVQRFPEMWLTEGRLDCDFDEGARNLTVIVVNALRIATPDEVPKDA
jgi:AcrR family transcriptional regulator